MGAKELIGIHTRKEMQPRKDVTHLPSWERESALTHGAKRKRCSHERCSSFAKRKGVCVTHGAKVEAAQQSRRMECVYRHRKKSFKRIHTTTKQ